MEQDYGHLSVVGSAERSAVELDLRHTRAWELRIKGASIDTIAEQMRIHRTTVIKYLNAAMDARALPDRVQELRLDLDRIDRYLEILDDGMDHPGTGPYEVARCIEIAVKLLERRAKMLLLDAADLLSGAATAASAGDLEVTRLIALAKDRVRQQELEWKGT